MRITLHAGFSALLLFLFFAKSSIAQCPITVDAGPDMFVCQPGQMTSLDGQVSGSFLGFVWDPIIGLDNPFILNPNATVTGPATYTLTAFAEDPSAPNLVNNPAFEGGNTGFTSSYVFNPTPITPGTYVITTSPSLVFANFPPCDDHTFGNGTGNMMLCNGTGGPADVWCQTIPVNPNTYYVLSGWITASPISPPEIQFSVNGMLIGTPFISSGVPCGWEQFSTTWYSGATASATVCITDQNSSGNGLFGDDFALDDIYMGEACSVSDEVNVDIVEVDAVLPFTTILPCNSLPNGIVLDGSGSTSGPNISYQWDGASIVSGGNTHSATVNEPGSYTLTITYDDGFVTCTDMATIEVLSDPNFVLAFASVPYGIDCINTLATLDGSGSFEGPTISYEWSPAAGIVSGQNTLYPEVNQGGTYTLLVTNSITGCTATAEVTVDETIDSPIAIANAAGGFTCSDTVQVLNGLGSSTGNEFSYDWSVFTFGNIIFGSNTIDTCVVDTAGMYQLLVTNNTNGCTATDTVTVLESINLPQAIAIAGPDLDCMVSTSTLTAVDSLQGDSIIYVWSTINGNIVSGDSTASAIVDLAGDYILTAIDTFSGCEATDTATILGLSSSLLAEAGAPVSIGCDGMPQQLDGTGSSTADVTYEWTTNGGNILSGSNTLMPMISAPAYYFLTVTDTLSGCFSMDSVLVSGNGNAPTAILSVSEILNCENSSVVIDGSSSSSGPDISIAWSSPSGNIVSGGNTLLPVVDEPGFYTLTLSDTTNNCSASIGIEVEQDTIAPTASIGAANVLNCYSSIDTIDAGMSSQGPNFSFIWTTQNGNFVEGDTTLQPVVHAPGVYSLTITNNANGCESIAEIDVLGNFQQPIADAGADQSLTCMANTAQLNGSASSQNGPFIYQWTTAVGNIVSGENTLSPTVDAEGIYVLEVIDTTNGCSALAGVSVDVLTDFPQANIADSDTLTCAATQINLAASASSGSVFQYLWSTANGNIISGGNGLTPAVDAPGTYELLVTDTTNGCTATDTVLVLENTAAPTADAGSSFTFSCSLTDAMLDGNGSSNGNNFTYFWTSTNGNIVSGENTLTPSINAPGIYQILVTDTANGCEAADTVSIAQDASAPIANAGTPDSLTCNILSLQLDGSASSGGPAFTYLWTTQNGNIVSDETTLSPQVDAPGTYLLTVLDTTNNCQSNASVQVGDATQGPIISAIDSVQFTCIDTVITLLGSATNVSFEWTTTNGNILSGENSATPVISETGTYLLTATDLSNGCTATAVSVATENTSLPTVNLQFPNPLTCEVDWVNITAWGSSSGADFTYLWTTPNGQISGDDTLAQATATLPGDYTFTVTDLTNGCTASAQLTVVEDKILPDAIANVPNQLGCGQTEVTIDGTGSSTGPEFNYFWGTANGNIVSGASTLFPTVDEPGEYLLTVINSLSGCSQTISVTVTEEDDFPAIEITTPETLTCAVEELVLDASNSTSGFDYSTIWTTTDGNILSGDDTLLPTVDAPGNYLLTITNTQTGCSSSQSVVVLENITSPSISAGPSLQLDCDNDVVVLQGELFAPQNADAAWSFVPAPGYSGDPFVSSSTTFQPTVNLPGDYTLLTTDPANGCTAEASTSVSSNILESFSFEKTAPTCLTETGSISFTGQQGGTPPYLYAIDGITFSTETVYNDLPAGTYAVSIMDGAGCVLSENISIADYQSFQVLINPVSVTAAGSLVHLNAIVTLPQSAIGSIVWTPAEGLSCDDCLDPFLLLTQNATYTVEIADTNGCTGSAAIDILVTEPNIDVFVPNVFSPNNDGINDRLVIFSKENLVSRVSQFRIFSRWGETVFEGFDFPPNEFDYGWDGTHRGKLLDGGVFTWMAEVLLANGETKLLSGDAVLVK